MHPLKAAMDVAFKAMKVPLIFVNELGLKRSRSVIESVL